MLVILVWPQVTCVNQTIAQRRPTFYFQHGGRQTGCNCSSGRTPDRSAISSAVTMFSKVADRRKHRPTLKKHAYVKFNIETPKPEVEITLVVLWIDMRFQMLIPCFHGRRHNGTSTDNIFQRRICRFSRWNGCDSCLRSRVISTPVFFWGLSNMRQN